jgi:hypothetical protein
MASALSFLPFPQPSMMIKTAFLLIFIKFLRLNIPAAKIPFKEISFTFGDLKVFKRI